MSEPSPDRTSSGAPAASSPWIAAILVAVVVACMVGLALQIAAWRSQSADAIHVEREPTPVTRGASPPPSPPPGDDHLPAYGEYVYIEELPEARTRVAPTYPDLAREANVEGTVVVQALVGRDGRVKETKVVNSVPALDAAAVSAVEQWTFTPAKNKGEPVAVWVAVPVRFTLQ